VEFGVGTPLEGYDGTEENKAKVTELIGMEAAAAKRVL
jgi:hypothetical protein